MIVKYSDDVKFQVFGIGFSIVLVIILFILKFYQNLNLSEKIFLISSFVFLIIFYIKCAISIGRTIILNENGCTITFLKYKKTYGWDKFCVKRLESYREPITVIPRGSFKWNGVILYSHNTIKPKNFNPELYSLFFAIFPFSYIFISLVPTKVEKYHASYARLKFQVNEDNFLSKMREWNVEIEDYR